MRCCSCTSMKRAELLSTVLPRLLPTPVAMSRVCAHCCLLLLQGRAHRLRNPVVCACRGPQVKKLVNAAYERASVLLRSNEHELHALAKELLDKESLTGAQARAANTNVRWLMHCRRSGCCDC